MKQLLILATLVLGLAVALSGLCLDSAKAYEFSATELAVAADDQRRLNDQRQTQADMDQAKRQSEVKSQLHRQTPQFDPQSSQFQPPATWNLYQDGRTSVCRRGANNAVFCQ